MEEPGNSSYTTNSYVENPVTLGFLVRTFLSIAFPSKQIGIPEFDGNPVWTKNSS